MPTMTPELQAAYNEWLLKFGFREVPDNTVIEADMILYSPKTPYEDWGRCVFYTAATASWRLRTLEEIDIYDENNK